MAVTRRYGLVLAATVLAGSWTLAGPARAQSPPLRIGVLSDLGGPFADVSGLGSTLAARMAAEDYRAQHPGRPVEVISADHQNKPDIGSALARRWVDTEGVDLVIDVRPNQDPVYGESVIRADGRRVTPVYVLSVKDPPPDNPSDVFRVIQTVSAGDGYRPIAEGHCTIATSPTDLPK